MRNPVKLVVAAGVSTLIAVGLGGSAFASPHADSDVDQHSYIKTHQYSSADTGDNLVGNFFLQDNLTLLSWHNENNGAGFALLSTGDATAGNTASTSVSQSNTDTVTATGEERPRADSDVDQHSTVKTSQAAEANTGNNVVGNAFVQTNANALSGGNENNAAGFASASTGNATATNDSSTCVTQSNNSTVTSTSSSD